MQVTTLDILKMPIKIEMRIFQF